MRSALAVPRGPVNLADHDPAARPLVPRGKHGKPAKASELVTDADALANLQERLFAEATCGGKRSVLLVLQGIDTAGKGGVVDHVVGTLGPMGVAYTGFKKPTDEEAAHHFLWRIRKRLPAPGIVGVFDRSHYEDVLVPRVHGSITEDEWQHRYEEINDFEAEVATGGTTLIKCFLHISYETQRQRLLARLDKPDKYWKFNPADLSERARWADYQRAFEGMLEHCNTEVAPWYVVPSDSKKYRNWAIAQLLHETLAELDPQYPLADFDVAAMRASLTSS